MCLLHTVSIRSNCMRWTCQRSTTSQPQAKRTMHTSSVALLASATACVWQLLLQFRHQNLTLRLQQHESARARLTCIMQSCGLYWMPPAQPQLVLLHSRNNPEHNTHTVNTNTVESEGQGSLQTPTPTNNTNQHTGTICAACHMPPHLSCCSAIRAGSNRNSLCWW